ncbi:hypothetical protein B0T24DRAFT_507678, partial [Lasiosphaeria ovina]
WLWEGVTCFLSVMALVATLVTLSLRHGAPLPQWPLDITVNALLSVYSVILALLSVYSVILKASVTFVLEPCIGQLQCLWLKSERPLRDVSRYDAAGRGAWGS